MSLFKWFLFFDNILFYFRTGFLNKWAAVGTPMRRGYSSEFHLKFPVLAPQRERTLTILDTDYKNFQVAVMIETISDSR